VAKWLETGRFLRPSPADGKVVITAAQLGIRHTARRDPLADAAAGVAAAGGRMTATN
jgi:hypothetical protein